MAPIDLNLVRAFVAVYETLSFSKAAERLGVPRSTVSRSVVAFERELKTELFRRTTRSVTATVEARELYDHVLPSLQSLERALEDTPRQHERPSGTLKVTATNDIGLALLSETTARFIARYPEVKCEVSLTPRVVDLVREGFDLALRVSGRRLKSVSNLVARNIGTIRGEHFASPAYLARHGTPRTRAELAGHRHLAFRGSAGRTQLNSMPWRLMTDDLLFVREVALNDGGIAVLPTFMVEESVSAGRLVRVLAGDFEFTGSVWLMQPKLKNPPARVAAFRSMLLEFLRQHPLD
ncbi:MAG: LysR family transcriptional regulator [Archangium sp.]|nr:LysR family transcriptional regulator [Archangium sp.]